MLSVLPMGRDFNLKGGVKPLAKLGRRGHVIGGLEVTLGRGAVTPLEEV